MTIKIALNFAVIMFLAIHMSDTTVAGNKVRRTRRLGANGSQNSTNKFKKGELFGDGASISRRWSAFNFFLFRIPDNNLVYVNRQTFGSRTLVICFKSIHRRRAYKMSIWNVAQIRCSWNWKRIPISRVSCTQEAISTIKLSRALSSRNTAKVLVRYRCVSRSINVTRSRTATCSPIRLSYNTIPNWSRRAMRHFRCNAISESRAVWMWTVTTMREIGKHGYTSIIKLLISIMGVIFKALAHTHTHSTHTHTRR